MLIIKEITNNEKNTKFINILYLCDSTIMKRSHWHIVSSLVIEFGGHFIQGFVLPIFSVVMLAGHGLHIAPSL